MSKKNLNIKVNQEFYKKIKDVLEKARTISYQTVNFAMVQAYWNIGRIIVEEEQKGETKAKYGQYLIKGLSIRLVNDYGKGFNESNLRYIRLLYLIFPIRHALRDELSWTHYRLLLKIKEKNIRDFYIKECIDNQWSTRQLERQINSFYYERILSSKNKKVVKENSKHKNITFQAQDIIKDPYVLEFLNLSLIKGAQATTAIEGNTLTEEEILYPLKISW